MDRSSEIEGVAIPTWSRGKGGMMGRSPRKVAVNGCRKGCSLQYLKTRFRVPREGLEVSPRDPNRR